MDLRFGLIFLLVMGATWHCDAIRVTSSDSQVSSREQERNIGALAVVSGSSKICKLCEQYVSQAVDYFAQRKTQTEIIDMFRKACTKLCPFKQECLDLVDNYVPLLFSEIQSIEPDKFCKSVYICEQSTTIFSQIQENSCGFCRQTVSKMLVKLKDPDTQMEVLQMLLKTCNSLKNHVKECKRLVFEYGPLILTNSEKFLERADICTLIRACEPAAGDESPPSSVGAVHLVADS